MVTALAFVDFTEATPAVVQTAAEMARAFGMQLILMHVSTPDAEAEGEQLRTDISREGIAVEMHRVHEQLQHLAEDCKRRGVDATALLVRGQSVRGNPIPKMIRELKRIKPALIVMGTHQHGRLFEALFGSASLALSRKATCPILLVPGHAVPHVWQNARNR
jgi:nucleotide-binding universal stress UspA family protein